MNIAITGSRGFVGKLLCSKLRDLNYKIIEINIESGYDIRKLEDLKKVPKFDVLIHLAARSFVPDSYLFPADYYNTNINGTINVLELCRKFNARIIFTSSYVYGRPKYLPIDESHNLNAFNPYAQSKLIGEQLCNAYKRDFNVGYTIFRPFNIYGPGQNMNFVIPKIIDQAFKGQIVLKDPRPKRDFVYIDDVVDAYIKAIHNFEVDSYIFNLGYGRSYSIEQIVNKIQIHMKRKIDVVFSHEYRQNEIMNTVADISHIMKKLDWEPRTSIDDGIKLTLFNL
jgi:nucleoside-diphosphate-sugar epimerase